MYQENDTHKQQTMFSDFGSLPEKLKEKIDASWAGTFYREYFCRIDESIFAVLYSEEASRPNVPVNVLLGLETLKAGFGWSDEEMHEAFSFNVQVRYALGYRHLSEGHFELRTMYNFRARLREHMEQSGEDLVEKAFEQITDEQIEALELKTGKLRMDSTQVASNIRQMSRLQLLVEVVRRMARSLSEIDRGRYAKLLAPYVKGTSGQYVYQTKPGDKETRIVQVGRVMQRLVAELAEAYEEDEAYQTLARVFSEHFVVTEHDLRAKEGQEISAQSVQSPDDLDATYRKKRGEGYRGYVANVTETCDPDNPVQLIVDVQVEPNATDDAQMMAEALPELKERTDVEEMYTDGGYNGEAVDAALEAHPVKHIQTAMRGGAPDPDRLHLSDFTVTTGADSKPLSIICPNGAETEVRPGRRPERYVARFRHQSCDSCPFADKCPTQPHKRKRRGRVLYFSQQNLRTAERRQALAQHHATAKQLRPAVEATVRSIKHPFRQGKLPVRGKPRVSMLIVGSAAMCNVRRLWRCIVEKKQAEMAQMREEIALLSASFLRFARRMRDFFFAPSRSWRFAPIRG
jgi:hypothetical protein